MRALGVSLPLGGWLLVGLLATPLAAALGLESRVQRVDEALARWELGVAGRHASRLLEQHPDAPEAWLAAARVAFHESDYELARQRAERAAAGSGEAARDAAHFLEYLDELRPIWEDFEEYASDHFRLRVTQRDRLLVPYALEALEAAAQALTASLGPCPERRVVVEVYPDRRWFIAASSLTREEVETSGTIAICHFNRIMIISPGALQRGYDWLDTLCHEYVHHVVYDLGSDTVPVWLHEGIARTLEGSWRGAGPAGLEPRQASILAEARDRDLWVSFAEMHPSMAKLPSGSLVALAFAQVATAVQLIIEQEGAGSVSRLVAAVRAHDGDLDAALGELLGTDLRGFEARARSHARSLPLERIPGLSLLEAEPRLVFVDELDAPPGPEEEAEALADRAARDFTILGDRLKGRGYHRAAVIEYDKALERLGQAEPLVVNRKAHALILDGRVREALPVLEETLRYHPSQTTTLDNLAEVHARLARAEAGASQEHSLQALELARTSERINPFNPDTHLRLAALLERLGRHQAAEQSRERLRTLREEARR